ncbi:ELMO domain-containing protein 3 [Mactra antiquata]
MDTKLDLGDTEHEITSCDDINFNIETPRDDRGMNEKSPFVLQDLTSAPTCVIPSIVITESNNNNNSQDNGKYEVENDLVSIEVSEDSAEIVLESDKIVSKTDEPTELNGNSDVVGENTENVLVEEKEDEVVIDCDVGINVDDDGTDSDAQNVDEEPPGLIQTMSDILPERETNVTDSIETDEMVSLDNIIVQDKPEQSDSDSEFDFDLPSSTKTTNTSSGPVSSQLVISKHESVHDKSENIVEKTKVTVKDDTPNNPPETTVSSKPVAVIKPTNVSLITSSTQQVTTTEETHDRVLEAAQAEWENVTTVQAGYKDTSTTKSGAEASSIVTVKPMSSHELIETLKQEDFTSVVSQIVPTTERHGFAAFVNFLFGPPKLHRDLINDRDRIFCIAATQLENSNESHMRTLQTIYKCLTGSKFDCPRFGTHWEEIGFQGTDPGTDLRGTGILSLLNLISLLKDPKTLQLASDIYRLSLHPVQNFPFCIMGINLSRIVIQALREGMLNKECNRRQDVFSVINDFYTALYLQMYQVWKTKGKTIADSGFVIKDIEARAKKNPRETLKHLEEFLSKKTSVPSGGAKTGSFGDNEFVNICDDK